MIRCIQHVISGHADCLVPIVPKWSQENSKHILTCMKPKDNTFYNRIFFKGIKRVHMQLNILTIFNDLTAATYQLIHNTYLIATALYSLA